MNFETILKTMQNALIFLGIYYFTKDLINQYGKMVAFVGIVGIVFAMICLQIVVDRKKSAKKR